MRASRVAPLPDGAATMNESEFKVLQGTLDLMVLKTLDDMVQESSKDAKAGHTPNASLPRFLQKGWIRTEWGSVYWHCIDDGAVTTGSTPAGAMAFIRPPMRNSPGYSTVTPKATDRQTGVAAALQRSMSFLMHFGNIFILWRIPPRV